MVVSGTALRLQPDSPTYAVEFGDGPRQVIGEGPCAFSIAVSNRSQFEWLLRADSYSAGLAFLRGEFTVRGDLIAAIRFKRSHSPRGLAHRLLSLLAHFAPGRLETWFQTLARARCNIRFHYDRSNEFYRQFLDSRMQYSEGYYKDASWPLEQAQAAKLDHICRKLELQPGERFLDIGCGWGGLAIHAAEQCGVQATGCTLSQRQWAYAMAQAEQRGLKNRIAFRELDYRDLEGRFDKIASVGMYEHVGRHRLHAYFEKIAALLDERGLFFNSGIVRPQQVRDDPETLFLQRRVFPGGELPHLAEVVRSAEEAGLEVLERREFPLALRADLP